MNQLFQSFGKENVGEFIHLTFKYLSESGIWPGNYKILVNDVCFTKFVKVFLCQNLALYGIY